VRELAVADHRAVLVAAGDGPQIHTYVIADMVTLSRPHMSETCAYVHLPVGSRSMRIC
jgi:hypothetical protein